MTYPWEKQGFPDDPGEYYLEVAKGNLPGEIVHKFGRNPNIPVSTTEDIWLTGGTMTWPTAAAVVSVTSTSANDDGNPTSNTGAHDLTIEGVDGSFEAVSETITLNGTSAVTTSASFLRVNRAYIVSGGTYHDDNEGAIIGTISGSTMFSIGAGVGQTEVARYSVPAGKSIYITDITPNVASNKEAIVTLRAVRAANDLSGPPYDGQKRKVMAWDGLIGVDHLHWDQPLVFEEYTDFWFEGFPAQNNTVIGVNFTFLQVDL